MAHKYDVLIIGSGAAGSTAARILKAEGLSVAMVESGEFGGTCALRGCEPKKVLAETAHAVVRVQEMARANGIRGQLSIDWPTLAARKQNYVDQVPPWAERSYQTLGIPMLRGRARFTGPNAMAVGRDTIEASKILLATGSRPRPLTFPGAELAAVSDDFLNLKELPPRLAFIGGGYISMEFAHIAAIAGAKVTMTVRGERCLKLFDLDLVTQLCQATAALDIEVRYSSPPHSIKKTPGGFELRLGQDGDHVVEADLVLHGAGRVPDLDDLNLDAAGIARDGDKLVLDDFLKTANPDVYAAGDAAGRYMLTPTAVMEGRVAAANILRGDHAKADYSVVPSATFTHPTLAGVGLTEEQLKSQGTKYEVKFETGLTWSELTRLGVRHSGYKALFEPGRGKLLGLFYLGEDAEEMVNLAALCMRQGLTVAQIMDMVWAYPSFGYTLRYMLG